jgi:squalene synthase HpnC
MGRSETSSEEFEQKIRMASKILAQLDTYGPDHCPTVSYEEAAHYTQDLAKSHYENFSVVSWFLPQDLREDFRNVYAFCRCADDLGDETGSTERSLELLAWWQRELDLCYQGKPRHPVYVALWRTIQKYDIPQKPFADLIDAFIQDQRITRYDTFPQVLDYCTRSADPVGRLVLYLCGYRDEARQRLSDNTCTALQLANFWQDVRRDVLERDRVYIPRDIAQKHGLDIDQMVAAIRKSEESRQSTAQEGAQDPYWHSKSLEDAAVAGTLESITPAYTATIKDLVNQTWPLFNAGRPLLPLIRKDVRVDIELFSMGGERILKLIEDQKYNTLVTRPKLSKGAKIMLMFKAVAIKLKSGLPGGHAQEPTPDNSTKSQPPQKAYHG